MLRPFVNNALHLRHPFVRFPVAIEAASHSKGLHLLDNLHLPDIAVAISTVNPAVHVHAVIEVSILRHFVNSVPGNWLAFVVVVSEFDNFRLVGAGHFMAVHTSRCRWNRGMARFCNAHVAIFAIDCHIAGVQLMRKFHGLLRAIAYSVPFGPCYIISNGKCCQDNEYSNRQSYFESVVYNSLFHLPPS